MQFRVEAVQVAVAWPSRVLQASTLLSSVDMAAPDDLRPMVPLLPTLWYLQESPTNPSLALAAFGQARVYRHEMGAANERRTMPWLDLACVAVQAVLRLAVCGLPALPPLENVGWDTLLESAPFIFPDPLLT
eukprot:2538275-Pleurochrysis_carterae.AAC.1